MNWWHLMNDSGSKRSTISTSWCPTCVVPLLGNHATTSLVLAIDWCHLENWHSAREWAWTDVLFLKPAHRWRVLQWEKLALPIHSGGTSVAAVKENKLQIHLRPVVCEVTPLSMSPWVATGRDLLSGDPLADVRLETLFAATQTPLSTVVDGSHLPWESSMLSIGSPYWRSIWTHCDSRRLGSGSHCPQ